jgi:exodeoxyribonuclease V alpha subunit
LSWQPEWARGLVAGDVDEASLYLATEAGGWPALPPAGRRAFALVVLASLDARAEGATRVRLDGVLPRLERLGAAAADRDEVARLLASLGTPAPPAPLAPLAPLVGRPGDYRPFIVDGEHLYHERDHRLEVRLAARLAARLRAPEIAIAPADLRTALAAAADPAGRRWTPPQLAAVEAALRRPLTVITGGPGSGKTAIIGAIVRAAAALGVADVAIAAPTGKAANRIAELLPPGAPVPSTLHRLLGHGDGRATTRGGAFRRHENRPLPHALVVVDEASMVGLRLMEQLSRALGPEARLVLVGDAAQLPAVEAGGVLGELAPAALRLDGSHRMDPADPAGAAVLEAARAVAAGALPARLPTVATPAELPLAGVACLDPDAAGGAAGRLVAALVEHWYSARLAPALAAAGDAARVYRMRGDGGAGLEPDDEALARALLDQHRRFRILTVTRRGRTGAERINAALARRFAGAHAPAPHGPGPGQGRGGGRGQGDDLAAGTPVLMTHNDYERGLFNGDQGLVLRVAGPVGAPPRPCALFSRSGTLSPFPLASLRGALEIAYASTVHKAQGSELDHAALVLPETDLPLLTRALVYTALTRVRRSIAVVGRRALLAAAIARPAARSSGLGERLAAAGAIDAAALDG